MQNTCGKRNRDVHMQLVRITQVGDVAGMHCQPFEAQSTQPRTRMLHAGSVLLRWNQDRPSH
jgi:hypothetical protein